MHTCKNHNGGAWGQPAKHGGIALNGCHFATDDSSTSGCSSDVAANVHRLADGATFVDKRNVAPDTLIDLVFSGPMPSTKLAPGTVERMGDVAAAERMLPGLSGGFDTVITNWLKQKADDPHGLSSLDRVAIDLYNEMWRQHGAKIGTRDGDVMRWSDGTVTDIEPCGCR